MGIIKRGFETKTTRDLLIRRTLSHKALVPTPVGSGRKTGAEKIEAVLRKPRPRSFGTPPQPLAAAAAVRDRLQYSGKGRRPLKVASFTDQTIMSGRVPFSYKLYLPASLTREAKAPLLPLVVMLHGCSQSPDDFSLGTAMNKAADKLGVIVAYPAQSVAANSERCWNWFRTGQVAQTGEMALIVAIVQSILQKHRADPSRVYVAGLSAGGATALALADAYPHIFSAVGVHSGLPLGAAYDPASAFLAMTFGSAGRRQAAATPTIVFHGDADTVVHPSNGRAVTARGLAAFPAIAKVICTGTTKGRAFSMTRHGAPSGISKIEHWSLHGGGHAWSGGNAAGSFADPRGPDASREMLRFFLQHQNRGRASLL